MQVSPHFYMELLNEIYLLGVWIVYPSPILVIATPKKKAASKKRPAKKRTAKRSAVKKKGVSRPKRKLTTTLSRGFFPPGFLETVVADAAVNGVFVTKIMGQVTAAAFAVKT